MCLFWPSCHFLDPFFSFLIPLHVPLALPGGNKKAVKVSISEFCYFLNLEKNQKTEPFKGVRFHPTCKLRSQPVSFIDATKRHKTPRSEIKELTTHTNVSNHSIRIYHASSNLISRVFESKTYEVFESKRHMKILNSLTFIDITDLHLYMEQFLLKN